MKQLFIIILLAGSLSCFGQHALYNTNTLFDSFENPAQKAFKADTSRKYAFNFFIPQLSTSFGSEGPADPALKNLIINGSLRGSNLEIGPNYKTDVAINLNNYLFTFKIFRSIKKQRELGFSWQIRSDSQIRLTNEILALFESYSKFQRQVYYENLFNSKLNSTTFHQFSITYRKNLDKRTGVGIKAGYLSGMINYRFKVDSSKFIKNNVISRDSLYLKGFLRTNVPYKEFDQNYFIPGIRNPGLALSLSGNHRTKSGWYLLANLKDLGFVKWTKDSYKYSFNNAITLGNTTSPGTGKRLGNKIDSLIKSNYKQNSYITPINSKAEVYVSRNFYFYTPALILSKNLFYDGTDIVLTNNFKHNTLNFNLSAGYSTLRGVQIGTMGMIKSDNFEFYLGSENLLKTYYTAKGIISDDSEIGNGNTGASFYLGLAAKFGRIVEHNANSSSIPGVGENTGGGFFRRIFRGRR